MNIGTFYEKTQAGRDALALRDRTLSLMARRLLIMVNPRQPIGVVMKQLGLQFEQNVDLVEELVRLGFIRPSDHQAPGNLRNPAPKSRSTAANRDVRFFDAQRYLLKVSDSLLADRLHPLYRSIELASSGEELMTCAESLRKIIATLSDRGTAEEFYQKVEAFFIENPRNG